MPRLAISAAARSRLQSGVAVITESLMWSPTRSLVGVLTAADRDQHVALADDPRAGCLLVDDDRRADPLVGHHPGRVAQRVAGSDGEYDLRHALTNFHLSPSAPFPILRTTQARGAGLC